MKFIPIELKIANQFIKLHHRHNKEVQGHRFSIGLEENGELIGVGIVGRPVARMLNDGHTVEVLRVCVKEGHPNACSKLYGRLRQISNLLGYEKVITYTLKKESQCSLKAIRALQVSEVMPEKNGWNRPSRHRLNQEVYSEQKIRWEL